MALKRKREEEGADTFKRAKVATVQTKLKLLPLVQKPIPSGKFEGREVKIACWNVNGLRACMQKDVFLKFIERPDLDLLCLNETKLQSLHTPSVKSLLSLHFPHQYFNCSESKKGYSGVAILAKTEPKAVRTGIGLPEFDQEGRVITADFDRFSLVVVYTPNSGRDLHRLESRVSQWDSAFSVYTKGMMDQGRAVVVVGDLNVVHQELDTSPEEQGVTDLPGTTPEEKEAFSRLLSIGLSDTFRVLHPSLKQFSWFATDIDWRKGRGRRLDYALVSGDLVGKVRNSVIHEKVRASDHCPIEVSIENVDRTSDL